MRWRCRASLNYGPREQPRPPSSSRPESGPAEGMSRDFTSIRSSRPVSPVEGTCCPSVGHGADRAHSVGLLPPSVFHPYVLGGVMDIVAGLLFILLLSADVWRRRTQNRPHITSVPAHPSHDDPLLATSGGGRPIAQRGVTEPSDETALADARVWFNILSPAELSELLSARPRSMIARHAWYTLAPTTVWCASMRYPLCQDVDWSVLLKARPRRQVSISNVERT